jgi:hypothetical protein
MSTKNKLKFGYVFSKDGLITGEQTTLRYSAYDTWLKSKDSYRKKYYEGESFTTAETVFGHEMHKVMESESLHKKHPILNEVPRYEVPEKDIVVDITDDIRIGGRLDSLSPERHEFLDYKFSHRSADGKAPWDAVKVAKHRQMVFYSILIEKKLARPPCFQKYQRTYQRLVWVETAVGKETHQLGSHTLETDSKRVFLTGNFQVFKRLVTKWEREAMEENIKKVAREIAVDYQTFLKINK